MPEDLQRWRLCMVVIILALCLVVYHEAKILAYLFDFNYISFLFQKLGKHPTPMDTEFGVMDLYSSWKPRMLSTLAGGWFTQGSLRGTVAERADFAWRVGAYSAFWMALTLFLYFAALGRQALMPILGTFCGVAFGYMPDLADRICPWDMPALFFWTAFVILLLKRRLTWLLPLLPLAVAFKETAALLPLAFLFAPGPWRRRLALFAAGMALAGATKLALNAAVGVHGYNPFNPGLFAQNIKFFFTGNFPYMQTWYFAERETYNHPVFINAGFVAAFFFAGRRGDPHLAMLRTLAAAFIAATLFCGIFFEYRIWFELIPISLYPFYRAPLAERGEGAAAAAEGAGEAAGAAEVASADKPEYLNPFLRHP